MFNNRHKPGAPVSFLGMQRYKMASLDYTHGTVVLRKHLYHLLVSYDTHKHDTLALCCEKGFNTVLTEIETAICSELTQLKRR